MDDLRQLLRYEIPGLITIIYFLMLSYPILFECANQSGICLKVIERCSIGNILLGLSAMAVALALPIGLIIYDLYTTFEYKKFLENRKGTQMISEVLERYPFLENGFVESENKWSSLVKELEWWGDHDDPAERNEILDVGFYNEEKERNLVRILERFINFYHSRRVIGIYAPLVASLATIFLSVYLIHPLPKIDFYLFPLSMISQHLRGVIVFAGNILILLVISILRKNNRQCFLRFFHWFVVIIAIVITFPISWYLGYFFFPLIILIISLIIIRPTHKNGLLKKQIEELETNMLLLKRKEIIKIIRARRRFDRPKKSDNEDDP